MCSIERLIPQCPGKYQEQESRFSPIPRDLANLSQALLDPVSVKLLAFLKKPHQDIEKIKKELTRLNITVEVQRGMKLLSMFTADVIVRGIDSSLQKQDTTPEELKELINAVQAFQKLLETPQSKQRLEGQVEHLNIKMMKDEKKT